MMQRSAMMHYSGWLQHCAGWQAWAVKEDEEPKKAASVEAPGHRSGPRALALASDAAVLLSTAAGEVKLWNPRSGACLRTIESGQVGTLSHSSQVCLLQCWQQRWVSSSSAEVAHCGAIRCILH